MRLVAGDVKKDILLPIPVNLLVVDATLAMGLLE